MMRSFLRCWLWVFLLLLTGCGRSLPPAELTIISGSEHNGLDPQRMSWVHDIRIARCLYEPLVTLDFTDMSLQPAVAQRWEVSDDKLTYTFHLREDARWSNGDPVTADDFVYAWRRAMLPDMAANYTRLMWRIRGAKAFFDFRQEQIARYARAQAGGGDAGGETAAEAVSAEELYRRALEEFDRTVGLEAPDDRTLVVELESPTPYFLDLVAMATFMPVHAASVEKTRSINPVSGMVQRDPSYWSDPARLVTNGPYILTARAFRRGLHLEANPRYWNRAAMNNGSINELVITNPQTALQAYEAGRAQAWLDMPSASNLAADLVAQDRDDVAAQTMAGTYFYNFNCSPTLPGVGDRPNPLADARVRRALSMAINREKITHHVTRLDQPIARSFVPPGVLRDYDPPVEAGITFDPDQARRLLAQAGYPGGKGLTGLSILYNNGQGHEYVAQAIKAMWEQTLGVVVTLEGVETKAFSDRLKSRDYTIARASWFGDYPDPTTWLDKMQSRDNNNDPGWANDRYDALLARAAAEPDNAARMALLRDAEAILLRECPMALIYQYVSIYLIKPGVDGLTPNAWARWELESAAVTASP